MTPSTLHSVHSVNNLVELLTLLRRKRDVYSHEAFVKAILFNYALQINEYCENQLQLLSSMLSSDTERKLKVIRTQDQVVNLCNENSSVS